MELVNFATEVIVQILSNAYWKDLISCKSVCRLLKSIVDDSVSLRYIIQLGKFGYVDYATPEDITTTVKLEQLLRLHQSWDSGTFAEISNLSLRGECQYYDLQAGVISTGNVGTESRVAFTEFPTERAEGKPRNWSYAITGHVIKEITSDPLQDLIAYAVETGSGHIGDATTPDEKSMLELRLRTMSSNEPHPSAKRESLVLGHDPRRNGQLIAQLVLRGTLLGATLVSYDRVGDASSQIMIWDWTTAVLRVDLCIDSISSFAFLDDSTFVFIAGGSPYTQKWFMNVYTIPENVAVPSIYITLELPELQTRNQYDIDLISLRSDPNTASRHPFRNPQTKQPLFGPDPDNKLLAARFTFSARNTLSAPRDIHFFFLSASILQFCQEKFNTAPDFDPFEAVPWVEWGPPRTRFDHFIQPNRYACNIHGMRYVPPTQHDSQQIVIWDFNPTGSLASSVKSNTVQGSSIGSCWISYSNVLAMPDIFKYPIESRLPFTKIVINKPRVTSETGSFMMDQNHIINTSAFDGNGWHMDVMRFAS